MEKRESSPRTKPVTPPGARKTAPASNIWVIGLAGVVAILVLFFALVL